MPKASVDSNCVHCAFYRNKANELRQKVFQLKDRLRTLELEKKVKKVAVSLSLLGKIVMPWWLQYHCFVEQWIIILFVIVIQAPENEEMLKELYKTKERHCESCELLQQRESELRSTKTDLKNSLEELDNVQKKLASYDSSLTNISNLLINYYDKLN